ncbi:ROK family transcriptional regulator [Devosia naphthalenivorans]|uniref:ROK family transcriptional regulator n=1 Tax=Devosia naphthalenivorans TaxID=2082392 RepID=UPI0013B06548|nr:ROK family transcriptional regulator [Devosia naphthalenivorans]
MQNAFDGGLSDIAQSTLAHLARSGEATRKAVAEATGISFPTTTAALAELTANDLVTELRREQGARGRATLIYGVSQRAGWIMGVDIGSTQISLVAQGLDGSILERSNLQHSGVPTDAGTLAGVETSRLLGRVSRKGPLLAVALALNQIVPRDIEAARATALPAPAVLDSFSEAAGLDPAVSILVENNVNCAAVAEHHDGVMLGVDDAAYMQMGVGLGLGFFCDGALIRGGYGASGELAQIPISWSGDVSSPRHAIEYEFGSQGLVKRAADEWPPGSIPPNSAEALFGAAESGNPVAKRVMTLHGQALGRIAATAATILDPSILVLGGGLSRNPKFSEIVVGEFRQLNFRTEIAISSKGVEASVDGAARLARDLAWTSLVGTYYQAALGRPTIYRGSRL